MEELTGKVAVITGAASGIGLAVARAAAGQGMSVVMADIEEGPLKASSDELAATGTQVLAVATDVSESSSVESLRDRALERFGAVHLVHNNAGVNASGMSWDVPEADWRWVLGVNLWGVIHGIRAFVPLLVDQGEGHVVNTGSLAGLLTAPFMGPYVASKHAVVGLSESLHKDLTLLGSPVGVSVLCPGFVRTGIADADRNRPSWAPARSPEPAAAPMADIGRQLIAAGIDPSIVANAVIDAVKQKRFYILTHPESKAAVSIRMGEIVEEQNPSIQPIA